MCANSPLIWIKYIDAYRQAIPPKMASNIEMATLDLNVVPALPFL